MKTLMVRVARRIFRSTNKVLNSWGILLSKPGVIHGSPAYSGATLWARRLNQQNFFYQKIRHLDGAIVESGVHWGYGILIHWTASNVIGGQQRHIYGFDSFQGHSKPTTEDMAGGNYQPLDDAFAITQDDVWKTMTLGTDIPKEELMKQITLVPGWMQETMPAFLKKHQALNTKLALIHADSDIYEPIRATLQNCWPLLQVGGIVILGHLDNSELMGKTKAVQECLAQISADSYQLLSAPILGSDGVPVINSYLVKLA
jgi:hypothetical protein